MYYGAALIAWQVMEYKVNTEDVFKRAKKGVQDLHEEIQTLKIQREEVSRLSLCSMLRFPLC